MPSPVMTALREFVGTEGPDAVVALSEMSLDRLDALIDAVLAAAATPPSAAPRRSQVWPLATLRGSTFASGGVYRDAAGPAGLNLNGALNPRLVGAGKFSDGVLRALLYSHGLVIEDPIAAAAEMTRGVSREMREVARLAVSAAASAMVEIAPLLDNDVVVTYFTTIDQQAPVARVSNRISDQLTNGSDFTVSDAWDAFEASYVTGLSPSLQTLWQRVRSGDKSPPLELLEEGIAEGDVEIASTFIKVLSELRPQAVVDNAVDMMASAVVAVEALGGLYDLLCPSPLFARLLFVGAADPVHELRLHELGRVDVPGIGELDVIDAVRIRQSSDEFAEWRGDLSEALTQAHEARERGESQKEASGLVRDVIADAREAIHRQARRSRYFTTTNLVSFVAGALGGIVAGSPGGLIGSSVGGAGGALAPFVQAGLNLHHVPHYLERHYLVFEPVGEVAK